MTPTPLLWLSEPRWRALVDTCRQMDERANRDASTKPPRWTKENG